MPDPEPQPIPMPDWSLVALLVAGPLLILGATAGVVLVVHVRRAERQAHASYGPRYAPHSAEPSGRWAISRLGDDLIGDDVLGDYGLSLTTDPDPPPWHEPQPPIRATGQKGR